ncbi:MAG: hypothetical protein Q7S36_00665 [Candidatus Liptonbacteria bacterium]|nr:hypothetical protein [Candidatus Liptonbacteria bacterium]
MKKYKYVFAVLAVLALVVSVAGMAKAENENSEAKKNNSEAKPALVAPGLLKQIKKLEAGDLFRGQRMDDDILTKDLPSSLAINPNGDVRMNDAKVASVGSVASSSGSLTVKIWGLTFTLNVSADSRLTARGKNIALSEIQVGDSVDISGTTSDSTPGVVLVRHLKDRTRAAASTNEETSRIRVQIEELIKKLNALLAKTGGTPIPLPSATTTNP